MRKLVDKIFFVLIVLYLQSTCTVSKTSNRNPSVIENRNHFMTCLGPEDLANYKADEVGGCGNIIVYKLISPLKVLVVKIDNDYLNLSDKCEKYIISGSNMSVQSFIYYYPKNIFSNGIELSLCTDVTTNSKQPVIYECIGATIWAAIDKGIGNEYLTNLIIENATFIMPADQIDSIKITREAFFNVEVGWLP